MPYNARISTKNPQAIIILVDQSGSMNEQIEWNGNVTTKARAMAEVINQTLAELIARCNHYGQFRHFFDIAVLGYSGRGVRSLLDDRNAFLSPAELYAMAKRVVEITNVRQLSDGRDVITHYPQPIWVEEEADGSTPMDEAFKRAFDLLAAWIVSRENKVAFPPLVINITDGEATDASEDVLLRSAEKIKQLKTLDGNVLLLNVHISANAQQQIIFPYHADCPTDEKCAMTLFAMSSTMPMIFENEIKTLVSHDPPFRGFAYNASISEVMRMLNLSSSTASLSQ